MSALARWPRSEDTVTLPRRARPGMSRYEATEPSIEYPTEPFAAPRSTLPSIDVEEDIDDYAATKELPRLTRSEITVTRPQQPSRPMRISLPPVPLFAMRPGATPPALAPRSSRPSLRATLSSLPPVPLLPLPRRELPPVPALPRSSAPDTEPAEYEDEDDEEGPTAHGPIEELAPPRENTREVLWPAPVPPAPSHISFAPGWGPPPAIERPPSIVLGAESVRPRLPTVDAVLDAIEPVRRVPSRFWLGLLAAVALLSVAILGFTAVGTRIADAGQASGTRVVTASDATGQPLALGTVYVDGVAECSMLPCDLDLTPGTHWVTLRAPGFDTPPARAVVVGQRGPTRLHFDLGARAPVIAPLPPPTAAPVATPVTAPTALPTTLAPAALPTTLAPTAMAASAPVAPAPVIAAPSLRTTTGIGAAAAPAAPSPVPAALAPARVNINAIPAAHVVLDGRPLGQTPVMGIAVAPGSHTVVFVRGKKRAIRGFTAVRGKTAVVAARL